MQHQPQVGNDDEGPVPRREGRPLRRVPHLRRRGGDRGRRHRRAERRRLHRQHASRPRPSDRQGRRSRTRCPPRSSSRQTGYNKGYGGSMHITDMSKGIMGMNGIVGASYYMAAGAAMRAHGARAPSRWRWRSSATARRRRRTTSARSAAAPTSKVPVHLRQREQPPVHGRPDGVHGADQVHLRVHQGPRHPASPRRRQRRVGGATRRRRKRWSGRAPARARA